MSRRSARSARPAGRTPSPSSPGSTWRTRTTRSWGCPAVSVRPFNIFGPGQIGGGAIRAFIEAALAGRDLDDPRRRLPDPRLVLRRRHGRRGAAGPRAPVRRRRELQRRQRPLCGHDLRPRHAHQAPRRVARARSASCRCTTPTSSSGSRTSTRHGRCSASRPRSSSTRASPDDRVVPRSARRGGVSGTPIRLARPDVGDAELAAVARGAGQRPADHGAAGRGVRARTRESSRDGRGRQRVVRNRRDPSRAARARRRPRRRGDRPRLHLPRDRQRRPALPRTCGARGRRSGDVPRPTGARRARR